MYNKRRMNEALYNLIWFKFEAQLSWKYKKTKLCLQHPTQEEHAHIYMTRQWQNQNSFYTLIANAVMLKRAIWVIALFRKGSSICSIEGAPQIIVKILVMVYALFMPKSVSDTILKVSFFMFFLCYFNDI